LARAFEVVSSHVMEDIPELIPIENGNFQKLSGTWRSASDEMDKRFLALETGLRDLGCHIIKCQEDVTGILVQECSRLTQQMQEQRDQLQQRTHDQVQKSLSRAREDIFLELHAELKRQLESSPIAVTKCRDNASQEDSASGSTTASEDWQTTAELFKLTNEIRKELTEVHSVLSLRASATEKRLEEVELGIAAQKKQGTDSTDSAPVDVCIPEQWTQLGRHRSVGSLSPTRPTSSLISVEKHINELIGQHSPRPRVKQKISEVDEVLERLTTAVTKALPSGPTDRLSRSSHPQPIAVGRRVSSQNAPAAAGHRPGSNNPPAATDDDQCAKVPAFMQLPAPRGNISPGGPCGTPEHGQPSVQPTSGQPTRRSIVGPSPTRTSERTWRSVSGHPAVAVVQSAENSPYPIRSASRNAIWSRPVSPNGAPLPGVIFNGKKAEEN